MTLKSELFDVPMGLEPPGKGPVIATPWLRVGEIGGYQRTRAVVVNRGITLEVEREQAVILALFAETEHGLVPREVWADTTAPYDNARFAACAVLEAAGAPLVDIDFRADVGMVAHGDASWKGRPDEAWRWFAREVLKPKPPGAETIASAATREPDPLVSDEAIVARWRAFCATKGMGADLASGKGPPSMGDVTRQVREEAARIDATEAGGTRVGVGVGVGYGPAAEQGSYFIPAGPPPTLLPPMCECGQGFDQFAKSLTADAYVCPCGLQVGGETFRAVTGPLWPKTGGDNGFFGVNRSTDATRRAGIRAWLPDAKGGLGSPAAMKLKLKQMQAEHDALSKTLEADFHRHLYASAASAPIAPSLPPPKRDPYVEHRVVALNNAAFDGDGESSLPESWPSATLNALARLAALRSEETQAREQAERLTAVLAEHGEPGALKAEMAACAVCGALSPHLDWSDARAVGWRHDTGADGEGVITCSDECALSAGGVE